jgi:hypothetical protein
MNPQDVIIWDSVPNPRDLYPSLDFKDISSLIHRKLLSNCYISLSDFLDNELVKTMDISEDIIKLCMYIHNLFVTNGIGHLLKDYAFTHEGIRLSYFLDERPTKNRPMYIWENFQDKRSQKSYEGPFADKDIIYKTDNVGYTFDIGPDSERPNDVRYVSYTIFTFGKDGYKYHTEPYKFWDNAFSVVNSRNILNTELKEIIHLFKTYISNNFAPIWYYEYKYSIPIADKKDWVNEEI